MRGRKITVTTGSVHDTRRMWVVGTMVLLLCVAAPFPAMAPLPGIPTVPGIPGVPGGGSQCPKPMSLEDAAKTHDDDAQDNDFREECLRGNGVAGAQPPHGRCITNKDATHGWAAISNPYLYLSAKIPSLVYRSYGSSENIKYGSAGYREKSGLFGVNGCAARKPLTDVKSATQVRRIYNTCANEYILSLRHNPKIIFEAKGNISYEDKDECTKLATQQEREDCRAEHVEPTDCQPLELKPLSQEDNLEFNVKEYLLWAAAKSGVRIKDQSTLPETVNDLTHPFDGKTYERIYDPSHPFSPRHDYVGNDRIFSLIARIYDSKASPTCSVACASVPVDVMRSRAPEWYACIGGRMLVNIFCYITKFLPSPYNYICYETLKKQGKYPPCSTRYDEDDNVPGWCNAFGKIDECCAKLRKPVPMINALKLRTYGWSNHAAPTRDHRVVPDVWRFRMHFSNHMPYMRWWDTGRAAGHTSGGEEQDPLNTLGSEDALVGVGREVPAGSDSSPNICRIGGPSKPVRLRNGLLSQLSVNILVNPGALAGLSQGFGDLADGLWHAAGGAAIQGLVPGGLISGIGGIIPGPGGIGVGPGGISFPGGATVGPDGISFPGGSIGPDGVLIDLNGIPLPGIQLPNFPNLPNGANVGGFTIGPGGVVTPGGIHIGAGGVTLPGSGSIGGFNYGPNGFSYNGASVGPGGVTAGGFSVGSGSFGGGIGGIGISSNSSGGINIDPGTLPGGITVGPGGLSGGLSSTSSGVSSGISVGADGVSAQIDLVIPPLGQFIELLNMDILSILDALFEYVIPDPLPESIVEYLMQYAIGQMMGNIDFIVIAIDRFASQIADPLSEKPKPDIDWMEFKLYQARTIAHYHLSCLGRYERLWKQYSSEEMALAARSTSYKQKIISPEALDAMSEEELKKHLEVRASTGIASYPWLGYASAHFPSAMFPIDYKGGQIKKDCTELNDCPRALLKPYKYLIFGLDKARPGDIIVYNRHFAFNPPPKPGRTLLKRLPTVAYVVAAENKQEYKKKPGTLPEYQYVEVVEWNNGKVPDMCGNTEAAAATGGSSRYLYKDRLPPEVIKRHVEAEVPKLAAYLERPGADINGFMGGDCYDPDLKECVENLWDYVLVYRPDYDQTGWNFKDHGVGVNKRLCEGEDGKMEACAEEE